MHPVKNGEITERLIDHFTNEGVPILTIHDSYVVPFGRDNDLIREMKKAFYDVTRVKNPNLKHTTINSDEYFWADEWDEEKQKAQGQDLGPASERHTTDLQLFKGFHKLPAGYPDWTPIGTAVY